MNDNHDDQGRDGEISSAIATVTVPDHRPGFWDDLDAAVGAAAFTATPTPIDTDQGLAPVTSIADRMRSPRRLWLLPLTGVASAVVLVAALVGGPSEESVRVEPADSSTITAPTDSEPSAVPSSSSATTVHPTSTTAGRTTSTVVGTASSTRIGKSTPDGAVIAWVEAIGAGRFDAATALVGPRSEAYITSLGGNTRGMMEESQEAYGAWATTPDRTATEVDLGVVSGVESTVVVIAGTWTGEGEDGYRPDAVPATKSGKNGTWLVEPMALEPESGERLVLLQPTASPYGLSGLAADAKIEAAAPGRGSFWFSLDDAAPVKVAGTASKGGVRGTWDPPGQMRSRSHLLVVAYTDGVTFTALAGIFAVEG